MPRHFSRTRTGSGTRCLGDLELFDDLNEWLSVVEHFLALPHFGDHLLGCMSACREFPPVSILGHKTPIRTVQLSGDPNRSIVRTIFRKPQSRSYPGLACNDWNMKDAEHSVSQSARRTTGILLMALTFMMLIPLANLLVRDADQFIQEELGLASLSSIPTVGWLTAIAAGLLYIFWTIFAVPAVRHHAFRWSRLKAIAVVAAIVSGVVEELIFRRLLMDWLFDFGIGSAAQVAFSAIVFGIFHSAWGLFARDAHIVLPSVAATTVLGAALATVYLLSDRILLPAAMAHIAINLVIEPGLLLSAVAPPSKRGRLRPGRSAQLKSRRL